MNLNSHCCDLLPLQVQDSVMQDSQTTTQERWRDRETETEERDRILLFRIRDHICTPKQHLKGGTSNLLAQKVFTTLPFCMYIRGF